ncbi:SDR family oxidoreductase [Chondrinema litorale]|uniref:SDR family oxidoreductase n=1 Tax=Chondrinema litorale TaxID=2994555 RepID=UPI002544B3B3|nr:SDR family oxidoreductase [Chondrinema litorale]UZR94568.1 SDR family oxidoreductase [Chondrinema litorale]
MKNFQDKVIWITGASSGIGEALVKDMAKRGAKIVLSARREEALIKVRNEAGLNDENSLILPLDLEHDESLQVTAKKVIDKFGSLDVLINNGGVSQRSKFLDTKPEVFRKIMEINFMGTVALTRAALPYLVKQPESQIVAVSSVVGKYGTPVRTVYSASKHAVNGFFDALRAELWQQNVKVLIVCPGYIKTNISFNALTADGSPQQKMDKGQSKGLSPENCATQIINAIRQGKREIYPAGKKELMGVYLKRFLPGVFSKIVRKVNVT